MVDVHYMYMNTTSLHIKIESDTKEKAQKTAEKLGLSLSAVMKVLLKQFIRTKRLSVGVRDMPEIPNARTRQLLKQAEQDMKARRGISFKNSKEASAYIDVLIENDRQLTK
jgi:DNA-damage-inducible protein J